MQTEHELPPPPPAPKKRTISPVWLVVGTVLIAGAVIAFVATRDGADTAPAASPTPKTQSLSGSMTLFSDTGGVVVNGFPSNPDQALGRQCWGSSGYDDIDAGADVTVTDESGTVIAVGALGPGEVVSFRAGNFLTDFEDAVRCEFEFMINDVPDAKFYGVEVSDRGELRYSRDELEANAWVIGLQLGD